jgi:hypothetical protein
VAGRGQGKSICKHPGDIKKRKKDNRRLEKGKRIGDWKTKRTEKKGRKKLEEDDRSQKGS